MTYEIKQNPNYNSLEVYFDGKPSEAVRNALKAHKFRWHSVKRCWYGYGISEESLAAAITGTTTEEEPASVIADGYMGGGAVYGSKSNRHLYGADLSAAVRADLKAAGIKGVTVKVHSYSGGQSLAISCKFSHSDYLPWEQYLAQYTISPGQYWIYTDTGTIHIDRYYAMTAAEQEQIRHDAAAHDYRRITTTEQQIHSVSRVDYLTAATFAKLEAVDAIVSAYRYDCSNSMVDYFDTNFYYTIYGKPSGAAA